MYHHHTGLGIDRRHQQRPAPKGRAIRVVASVMLRSGATLPLSLMPKARIAVPFIVGTEISPLLVSTDIVSSIGTGN